MGIDLQEESTTMANDALDPETGKFTSKYTNEEFLSALHDLGEAGTADVAEAVGCNRETARLRLNELVERGAVERRKIAGAILWKPGDDGQ